MKAGIGSWSFVALTTLLSFSAAQATTATGTAAAATHTVQVGASGGVMYSPNTTYANPGDTVLFEFYPTNHSVIRGEYAGWSECGDAGCNPCVPYELYHPGTQGFFSTNFEVASFDMTDTWSLLINDTGPVWFYCDALESCHPNGMVGVINPNESVSLDKQYQAAQSANYQLGPGQSWPAEGGSPSSAATSAAASSGSHHHANLSGGAIAGIAVGVAVVVIGLAGALFFFIGRNRAYSSLFKSKSAAATDAAPSESGHPGSDSAGWTPAMGAAPWAAQGEKKYDPNDPRFSHMTGYSGMGAQPPNSPGPDEGRFVGYNRHTGAPEFAAEAPMDTGVQEMAVPGGAINAHAVELDSGEVQHARAVDEKK